MSQLIKELRAEHQRLLDSFSEIKYLRVSSEETPDYLQSVKHTLLEHLKKENATVYAQLRDVSFDNLRLQRTLDLFMRDTVRLSTAFIRFLDAYSRGGSDADFKRDFNRLLRILDAYTRREEQVIFSEYQKMLSDRVA